MNDLIPPFEFHHVFIAPWTDGFSSNLWVALMGFFVTASCGLVGNYLILRRMALVGDAISHSVLPGLAIAFLISAWAKPAVVAGQETARSGHNSTAMFLGALAAGLLTTVIIEVIHKKSRVKQDSAIGIAFTSLFALGVILISLFAAKVDLDQECVLYGEILFVPLEEPVRAFGMLLGPSPVLRMGIILILTVALILLFYKELLVSSFDAGLAASLGINATFVHYSLMCWLSIVVVSAFESVGAILVIAMLILPGATASLLSHRLSLIMVLTIGHAALSSIMGIHLSTWLDCSTAAAMVVMATFLFVLAWVFSPSQGLLRRWFTEVETGEITEQTSPAPTPAPKVQAGV